MSARARANDKSEFSIYVNDGFPPIVPGVLPLGSRAATKRRLLLLIMAVTLWLPAVPAGAQAPSSLQDAGEARPEPKDERQVAFSFDRRPSLRVGRLLRFDLRVKSQAGWRDFPDEAAASSGDVFDLPRARVGVDGRVSRYVEYQVEREMRGAKRPWRDVFANVRPLRALQVQVGRFKMPFSLDQTTSSMDVNFAYRSLAATYLAPSRDVGVMAHGGLFRNGLRYEAGIFREGGDNARVNEGDGSVSQRTMASRLVVRPWNATERLRVLRSLTVGAAVTAGRVPEGLNGLRAETIPGTPLVDRVYVNGLRRRLGAEMLWRPGPVSVQGEVIRVSDQRRGQGIDNEDLPDAVQRGWYVSGTWLITGEEKKDNIDPARPFLQGGFGALEIAGRVEALTFGSGPSNERPSPGPRAHRILERKDAVWTVGMNWYVNRFVRIQADLIREQREEGGAVLPTLGRAWSRTLRVQFQL